MTTMGRARVAVAMWLGLVSGGCLEGPSPLESSDEGKVELTAELATPLTVQFIPEAKMALFLEVELSEARAGFENAAFQRSDLKARADQKNLEAQLAANELRERNFEIFLRRLEVVRRAVSVRELDQQRRALTWQSVLATKRFLDVGQQAAVAQQDWRRSEDAARRLEDGSFLVSVLPSPLLTTTLEPGEDGQARLAPGRYAVAATTLDEEGRTRVWLLWVHVDAGEVARLLLDDENLAFSECSACVISPASPLVERY
jgi:hypothetical protein